MVYDLNNTGSIEKGEVCIILSALVIIREVAHTPDIVFATPIFSRHDCVLRPTAPLHLKLLETHGIRYTLSWTLIIPHFATPMCLDRASGPRVL